MRLRQGGEEDVRDQGVARCSGVQAVATDVVTVGRAQPCLVKAGLDVDKRDPLPGRQPANLDVEGSRQRGVEGVKSARDLRGNGREEREDAVSGGSSNHRAQPLDGGHVVAPLAEVVGAFHQQHGLVGMRSRQDAG